MDAVSTYIHKFEGARRAIGVLFICRETDSNYCCVWIAEIWTHSQLDKRKIAKVLMSKVSVAIAYTHLFEKSYKI